MLKVAQQGEKGLLVILGFSFANLRLMQEGKAVQFLGSEVQLGEGVLAIAHRSDPQVPVYQALLGRGALAVIVLDDPAIATLKRGGFIDLPLRALGVPRDGNVFILAGETEDAIVRSMREAGLVTDATVITGPGPKAQPLWHVVLACGVGVVVGVYEAATEDDTRVVMIALTIILAGLGTWAYFRGGAA
jgi:hypothetical protein